MPKKGECMNLLSKRFGRWTVVSKSEPRIDKNGCAINRWLCKCDCGNEKIVLQASLISGRSKSCGCLNKDIVSKMWNKHGLSNVGSGLYSVWHGIKYRCYCKSSHDYPNYGGRGITICEEWKNDFKAFHDWAIANGYKEEKTDKGINILTIDRIDVNGNYEPSNCRFVTNEVQAKNKRNTIPDDERFRVCPVCGKIYEIHTRKGTNTCSQSCGAKFRAMKLRNTKKMSYCVICGKEFEKRIDHGKEKKYCSRECMGIGKSPFLEYNGEKRRVIEWASITGIEASVILTRLKYGWDIEKILTTPTQIKNRGGKK